MNSIFSGPVLTASRVAVSVMLAMVVILAPFLGVSDSIPQNTKHLWVGIVNLDGASSQIAPAFSQYLTAAAAVATSPLPEYRAIVATSETEAVDRVKDSTCWGVVVIRPGATARLMAAFAAAPNASNPAFASYDPNAAISYVWSEGRNPMVSTRSSSPTRALLTKFPAILAQNLARQMAAMPGGSTKLAAIASSAPWFLTSPVGFVETNIAVAFTMPTAMLALTVGSVLIVVLSFGAVRLTVRMLPTPAEAETVESSGGRLMLKDGVRGPLTPLALLGQRAATMFVGSLAVSLMYSILVVGMAGSTYRYGGEGWARLWAIQLLVSCCYTWFIAGLAELTGDADVSTAFIPVAYYSTLSSYNLDTANEGYNVFQYNPVYWSTRLLRNNFFGALDTPQDIGTALGILFAWAVFSAAFYPFVALWLKPKLQARFGGFKPAVVPAAQAEGLKLSSKIEGLELRQPKDVSDASTPAEVDPVHAVTVVQNVAVAVQPVEAAEVEPAPNVAVVQNVAVAVQPVESAASESA